MDTGYKGLANRATERKQKARTTLYLKLDHRITVEDIKNLLCSMNGYDVARIQLDAVRLMQGKQI